MIYFAPTIFQAAGLSSASAAILATAGVGVVNVAMTVVAIRLIDSVGRRALLLTGLAGMAVCLILLGLGFALGGGSGALGWITALSLAAYVGFFAIGLGPVFWLLISEIFPLYIRGRGMGVATIANWGFNLLVTVTFLELIERLRPARTFFLYGLFTVAAFSSPGAWCARPRAAASRRSRPICARGKPPDAGRRLAAERFRIALVSAAVAAIGLLRARCRHPWMIGCIRAT